MNFSRRNIPPFLQIAAVAAIAIVVIGGAYQGYQRHKEKTAKVEAELRQLFFGSCWWSGDSDKCVVEAERKVRTLLSLSDEAEQIAMLAEACRKRLGRSADVRDSLAVLQKLQGQGRPETSWEQCRNEARELIGHIKE